MKHLLNCLPHLKDWLNQNGQPAYRMEQIENWIFKRRVTRFDQMSDLPNELRGQLSKSYSLLSTTIVKHSTSDDGTEKLLLKLADGEVIECVLLRNGLRRSICVSSQVGCAMGCVFCASGLDGVMRNLTTGEIIEQMLLLQQLLPTDERLSHIVMMGMGEPLANLDQVLATLDRACSPQGLGISPRRITISTVGLPAALHRLAKQDCRFNLAISLHAPTDELRNQLVPVNSKIGISAIMAAAENYFQVSGRKLTFEYVMLKDINDGEHHAHELAALLKSQTALLNVIPYNPVAGLPYQTPTEKTIRQFRLILEQAGIEVKFRRRKGDKINAACGQLRRQQLVSLSPEISSEK